MVRELALVVAGLGLHFVLSQTPPTQVAIIYKSLCSSWWVAPTRIQVAADFGVNLLGGPRASLPSGQPQTVPEHQSPSPETHSRGELSGQQSLLNWALLCEVSPHGAAHSQWSWLVLTAYHPGSKALQFMCQQQSRLNQDKRIHTTHTGSIRVRTRKLLGHQEAGPLGSNTGYKDAQWSQCEIEQRGKIHKNEDSKHKNEPVINV